MKTPGEVNDNLISHTIDTWESRLDRNVSREEARQIIENLTGFFSVLAEWAPAEIAEPPIKFVKRGEM